MSSQAAKDYKLSFLENFLLSGAAAVTSKTAAAPIERIKLLIQNQGEMLKTGRLATPYAGILDCTKRVVAEEGVASLWLGNFANCARYFPTQALNFAFKGSIKQMFKVAKTDSTLVKLGKNVASGGAAGALSLSVVYSLDYCRTRMANDLKGKDGKRQYSGMLDVYKQTIASDGIAGLYRGFAISCVGIIVYRGAYFGFFDTFQPLLQAAMGGKKSLLADFVLGYFVTVGSGLIAYPLDTIRRRMMMTSGTGVVYKNSLDCATQILKEGGVSIFFRGCAANILRSVAVAGVLAGFDSAKAAYINFKVSN
jgi:solute carrier family 25 (adenine nucleotide translocator) protein 4/5/6/31